MFLLKRNSGKSAENRSVPAFGIVDLAGPIDVARVAIALSVNELFCW